MMLIIHTSTPQNTAVNEAGFRYDELTVPQQNTVSEQAQLDGKIHLKIRKNNLKR